jgi:hypothetical protein
MLISFQHQFIFLKTFKTASTTTDIYFEQYCADDLLEERKRNEIITEKGIIGARCFKKNSPNNDFKFINHLNAKKVKKHLGDEKFNLYLKFCNVRNPYDLLVSNFFYYHSYKDMKFDEFINNRTFIENIKKRDSKIYMIDGKIIVDDYIKYENISSDINRISEKLNLPISKRELGFYIKSKRRNEENFMSFYTKETKKIVENVFDYYFEFFKY